MQELNNFLLKEANDMVPRRGLLDTNQQGFEIFVSSQFRDVFDKIHRPTEGVSKDLCRIHLEGWV
jgi:hypothetical protein